MNANGFGTVAVEIESGSVQLRKRGPQGYSSGCTSRSVRSSGSARGGQREGATAPVVTTGAPRVN